MKKTLLLCFIHGFKGDAETFWGFPQDPKGRIQAQVPEDNVQLIVYPKYETKGDLSHSTQKFLTWLKEQVISMRREHCHTPWPPNDKEVSVILVAHSMGGFVASDALISILDDRWAPYDNKKDPKTATLIFPYIRGILAFDTPYNGLARSMFVYGAFSHYQKVSNIWNIMSATSAGLMSASSMGTFSGASRSAISSGASRATVASAPPTSGWRFWQNVAFKTGTVGAIAAGGVAAYRNRESIIRSLRNINRTSIKEGAESGYDALGQGLAYINRDSVGQSFAWMSSHLKFVGALLRQKELIVRLERLAAIEGIGIKSLYTSLGENGYWTGGYFVPERAFCAIPAAEQQQKAHGLFARTVNTAVEDEVQAHVSMFRPQLNDHYDEMADTARDLCIEWFRSEADIVDVPQPDMSPEEVQGVDAEEKQDGGNDDDEKNEEKSATGNSLEAIGESPLDIAAAAAIPLPVGKDDDEALDIEQQEQQRQRYLQNLLRISQRAGSGLTSITSLMPSGATLNTYMPNVSSYVPKSMPTVSRPHMPSSVWPFGRGAKKDRTGDDNNADDTQASADVKEEQQPTDSIQLDDDDDIQADLRVATAEMRKDGTENSRNADETQDNSADDVTGKEDETATGKEDETKA